VVLIIDDGHNCGKIASYSTCLAMQVLCDDKDWSVREFFSYKELFRTIIKLGHEHGRRSVTAVRATVPILPVHGHTHVFAVLSFEKRGHPQWLHLVDARTLTLIPDEKIEKKQPILGFLDRQYWITTRPDFQSHPSTPRPRRPLVLRLGL
jgi:hypothetical protein